MRWIDWLLCRLHWCRHVKRTPSPYGWEYRCERCGHLHEAGL